jgi:cytochrome b6-f complex iron-sulfur subunit
MTSEDERSLEDAAGGPEDGGQSTLASGELSRRQVIGVGLTIGVGAAAACVPIARYLGPIASAGAAAEVQVPLDRLVVWEAEQILMHGVPCLIVRTPQEIFACSAVCPHLGCIVKWNRSRRTFFCPCHGARFAPDGRVLGGPSPAPLTRHTVAVEHGNCIVEPA